MIRQPRFHKGRNAQRFVNAARIVVGEMNAVRRPEVGPLLAEGVCQSRQAAHAHANGEILALWMAGANFRRVGVPHHGDLLRVRYVGRVVPALALGIGFRVELE